MKIKIFAMTFLTVIFIILLVSLASCSKARFGETIIEKWKDGKYGAISLTFDDGSINQFRVAMPIMDSLNFPGTFFINTGNIPGSKNKARFMGRPQTEIITESAKVVTNRQNLFERASLVAYAPYEGLRNSFTRAGELFESGKIDEACKLIDESITAIRIKKAKPRRPGKPENTANMLTWDKIRSFAAKGHEFASHTITHPRLAILDSLNIVYELEGSRTDILEQLGEKHVFSAECPYGTEDERVMRFAYRYYPALRNRMPESFLMELNRGSRKSPVNKEIEYVQWQRGALSSTPMQNMKAWVDTTAAMNNIWLVLVFHGVDGIGWEALSGSDLRIYYNYLKSKEERLWVATFGDVARYMRERMNAGIISAKAKGTLEVRITHNLGKEYDYPLTLKTYVSGNSENISIKQGTHEIKFIPGKDEKGFFVRYNASPNSEPVILSVK